jgi:tRNA modification GTPase
MFKAGDLLVITKSDMESAAPQTGIITDSEPIKTSVVMPGGLSDLKAALELWIKQHLAGADFPVVTQMRHRQLLTEASSHLHRAISRHDDAAELMAEDVRLGARALEQLSGRVNPETVLDRVFSAFCIGK